jgi:hypothetical protein
MHRRLQVILFLAALASILATPSASGGAGTPPGKQPPANTSLPTIGGTPLQGSTLSASTGGWSGTGLAFAYQWYGCDSSGATCSPLPNQTSSTHAVAAGDVGKTLRVAVVATNKNGTATATSQQTSLVTPPPSTPPPPTTTTTTTTTTP